jgi:hypothetical protein
LTGPLGGVSGHNCAAAGVAEAASAIAAAAFTV